MSPITEEQIIAAVTKALDAHKDAYWIEAEQHYQDHQALLKCRRNEDTRAKRQAFIEDLMELDRDKEKGGEVRADLSFVRAVRAKRDQAFTIGWKMLIVAGVGFIGIAAWERVISVLTRATGAKP